MKRRRPDLRFRLLGPFLDHPDAIPREVVEGWHREGVIEYLGEHDDVRPALESCSVFVLPTAYNEGVPRSVLEAMAVGRPVVTSTIPGCRATVVDGENGFLVPPRDVKALVAALNRFVDAPGLVEPMGVKGRERVAERYDVRSVTKVVLGALGLDGERRG